MFSLSGSSSRVRFQMSAPSPISTCIRHTMRDLLTAMFEDINEMNRSNVFALHIDSESTGRPGDAAV